VTDSTLVAEVHVQYAGHTNTDKTTTPQELDEGISLADDATSPTTHKKERESERKRERETHQ
jgi:hypothetical protein